MCSGPVKVMSINTVSENTKGYRLELCMHLTYNADNKDAAVTGIVYGLSKEYS